MTRSKKAAAKPNSALPDDAGDGAVGASAGGLDALERLFARMERVTCRHARICFQPQAQDRSLRRLRYGLSTGGDGL